MPCMFAEYPPVCALRRRYLPVMRCKSALVKPSVMVNGRQACHCLRTCAHGHAHTQGREVHKAESLPALCHKAILTLCADLTDVVEGHMVSKRGGGGAAAWLQQAFHAAAAASVVVNEQLSIDRDFDCRLAVAAQLTAQLRARVASELDFTVSAVASSPHPPFYAAPMISHVIRKRHCALGRCMPDLACWCRYLAQQTAREACIGDEQAKQADVGAAPSGGLHHGDAPNEKDPQLWRQSGPGA